MNNEQLEKEKSKPKAEPPTQPLAWFPWRSIREHTQYAKDIMSHPSYPYSFSMSMVIGWVYGYRLIDKIECTASTYMPPRKWRKLVAAYWGDDWSHLMDIAADLDEQNSEQNSKEYEAIVLDEIRYRIETAPLERYYRKRIMKLSKCRSEDEIDAWVVETRKGLVERYCKNRSAALSKCLSEDEIDTWVIETKNGLEELQS